MHIPISKGLIALLSELIMTYHTLYPRRSRTNKKKAKPLTAISHNAHEDDDDDEDSAQSSSDHHTVDVAEDNDHDADVDEEIEEDTRNVTVQLGNTILVEGSHDKVTGDDSCGSSSTVRPASEVIVSTESAPTAQSSVTPLLPPPPVLVPSPVPPISAFSGRLLAHAINADRHKEADRSANPLLQMM